MEQNGPASLILSGVAIGRRSQAVMFLSYLL